jgi:hypothetical protein
MKFTWFSFNKKNNLIIITNSIIKRENVFSDDFKEGYRNRWINEIKK